MDGAERMDAKLAEDAADDCEARDGGAREPPCAAPDLILGPGFACSALINCLTTFRSVSLSSFFGLIDFLSPLQTKTTVTRRDWIRMRDRDCKDTFRLSRAAVRPGLIKHSSQNMSSLYQDTDRSFERSISARNSSLLYNSPGTGSLVADDPFGHRDRAARVCLTIPDDLN